MKPLHPIKPPARIPLTEDQKRRNRISAVRAYCAARKHFKKIGTRKSTGTWLEVSADFRSEIKEIVSAYWITRDREEDYNITARKAKLRRYITKLKNVKEFTRKFSAGAREELNKYMIRMSKNDNTQKDQVGQLIIYCTRLERALTAATNKKIPKKKYESITDACDKLWRIRETITGEKFIRNWDATYNDLSATERSSRSGKLQPQRRRKPNTLIGHDASFVADVIKAIDTAVTVSAVLTALRSTASKRNSQKKTTLKPLTRLKK